MSSTDAMENHGPVLSSLHVDFSATCPIFCRGTRSHSKAKVLQYFSYLWHRIGIRVKRLCVQECVWCVWWARRPQKVFSDSCCPRVQQSHQGFRYSLIDAWILLRLLIASHQHSDHRKVGMSQEERSACSGVLFRAPCETRSFRPASLVDLESSCSSWHAVLEVVFVGTTVW